MCVVEDDRNHLWDENKIAIHFEDRESMDEKDYRTKVAKNAVRTFRTMNDDGGYIWAEYRNIDHIKIGIVNQSSYEKLETDYDPGFLWERYGRRLEPPEKKAILKTREGVLIEIDPSDDGAQKLYGLRPRR